MLLGVGIGWLRLRSASVWPAVFAHGSVNAAVNLLMVTFFASGQGPDFLWDASGCLRDERRRTSPFGDVRLSRQPDFSPIGSSRMADGSREGQTSPSSHATVARGIDGICVTPREFA